MEGAIPLKSESKIKYSPLTYHDFHEADSIRSQILTPRSPFPVHMHLRLRGEASVIFDRGIAIDDILENGRP